MNNSRRRPGGRLTPSQNSSKRHIEPKLGFEIIDGVVFDDRHAEFEREGDIVGEFFAEAEVEGDKPAARLTRDRVTVVNADVRTREKSEKPSIRQSDV